MASNVFLPQVEIAGPSQTPSQPDIIDRLPWEEDGFEQDGSLETRLEGSDT